MAAPWGSGGVAGVLNEARRVVFGSGERSWEHAHTCEHGHLHIPRDRKRGGGDLYIDRGGRREGVGRSQNTSVRRHVPVDVYCIHVSKSKFCSEPAMGELEVR